MYVDDNAGEPDEDPHRDEDPGEAVEERPWAREMSLVEVEDGYLGFTDADHDGHAELMYELNDRHEITAQARFDEAKGEWVPLTGPIEPPDGMRVDAEAGASPLGTPTVDTDRDGRADTTIVAVGDGGALLYTDIDGDGAADVVTEISATGEVTVARHTGVGEWSAVERGRIGADGIYHGDDVDDPSGDGVWGPPEIESGPISPTHIDPKTGRWTEN